MKETVNNFYKNLKNNKKTIFIFIGIIFAILTAAMAVAAFYDLNISKALHNPTQPFSKFMADYGEWPMYLVNLLFPSALFVYLLRKKKYWLCFIPLAAGFAFGYFFLNRKWVEDAFMAILINLVVIAILCVAFYIVKEETLKKLLVVTFIITAAALLSGALTTGVKYLWGRVRFRNLNNNFTPWYAPNGPNGNNSFPSGHTSAACSLLILVLIPFCFNIKNKLVKSLFFIIPALYIMAMAVSRIVVGAHYLSDVTFAAFYNIAFLILVTWVVSKIKIKEAL